MALNPLTLNQIYILHNIYYQPERLQAEELAPETPLDRTGTR